MLLFLGSSPCSMPSPCWGTGSSWGSSGWTPDCTPPCTSSSPTWPSLT
ncbi:olfactory receptor 2A25 [Prionailurus iriomotensis]